MASMSHMLLLLLAGFPSAQFSAVPQQSITRTTPDPCEQKDLKVPKLPEADGNLHVYALPIGQGDAHVVQCPDGALSIIDMGSSEESGSRFWEGDEIRSFFGDKINKVETMVVTHNHYDHYSLYPKVFTNVNELTSLRNIYVSCQYENLNYRMTDWIENMSIKNKVRTFNNGDKCGPNNVPCQAIDMCPKSPEVVTKVLAANLGQHCTSGNKNMDSIVFKLKYKSVSVLFNGDFEDETWDWNEDGPQRQVANFYGSQLISTIYQIAHHGASRLANKPIWTNNIKPKAIFASSNPWYTYYRHPRCYVIDAFIKYVKTLCKPEVTDPSDAFYCGAHVSSTPLRARLQRFYTCGEKRPGFREVADNEYAIYDTVPNQRMIQLVHMKTDGTRWGFENEQLTVQD